MHQGGIDSKNGANKEVDDFKEEEMHALGQAHYPGNDVQWGAMELHIPGLAVLRSY